MLLWFDLVSGELIMILQDKKYEFVLQSLSTAGGRVKQILSAVSIVVALFAAASIAAPVARADGDVTLREGWRVQSSAKVTAGGEAVSASGFDVSSWYKTSAPNTVFAVLVENGV